MRQRHRDPVEERLATDEAMIGQQVGAKREMLARAEPDFEVKRTLVAEQSQGVDRALGGQRQLRQQAFDERGLRGAQLVPGRSAVEAVQGGRIGRGLGHRRGD